MYFAHSLACLALHRGSSWSPASNFLGQFFFAVFCAAAMDDFLALCFASRSHLPVFFTAFVLSV